MIIFFAIDFVKLLSNFPYCMKECWSYKLHTKNIIHKPWKLKTFATATNEWTTLEIRSHLNHYSRNATFYLHYVRLSKLYVRDLQPHNLQSKREQEILFEVVLNFIIFMVCSFCFMRKKKWCTSGTKKYRWQLEKS